MEAHSRNAYPLRLRVHAKIDEGEKVKVWDGDQKRLFKKYPDKRAECIEEIRTALEKIRNDIQ